MNELYHYGVLGMKWGVRRYQNADGTRTAEGKRREQLGITGPTEDNKRDYYEAKFRVDREYYEKSSTRDKGKEFSSRFKSFSRKAKKAEDDLNSEIKNNKTTSNKVSEEKPKTKTFEEAFPFAGKNESNSKDYVRTDLKKDPSKVSDSELKDMLDRATNEARYRKLTEEKLKKDSASGRTWVDKMTRSDASNLAADAQAIIKGLKSLKQTRINNKLAKQNDKNLKLASEQVKGMSNEELAKATERRRLENNYYSTISNGREYSTDILDKAGQVVTILGGALMIASTINTLKNSKGN